MSSDQQTPDKYIPDDLGVGSAWDGQKRDRTHWRLPQAAIQHLGVTGGDELKAMADGPNAVRVELVEQNSGSQIEQKPERHEWGEL